MIKIITLKMKKDLKKLKLAVRNKNKWKYNKIVEYHLLSLLIKTKILGINF